MNKIIFFLITLCCTNVFAADLVEVYQQAQISDPIFMQAISQNCATQEGVPISIASLLPNINFTMNPSITNSTASGSNVNAEDTPQGPILLAPRSNTVRAYNMALNINQTIFNFAQYAIVAQAVATSKQSNATLNAALQNLMIRVANAYFAILKDEDNLSFNEASKLAYAEQLDQVKQQYAVGLKTITDVYTAQASYDSAVASYLAAETTLNNDKENLRVITGKYYPRLYTLSNDFPLVTPQPANVESWVSVAIQQNWTIKAAQYAVDAAREVIKQQYAGHLPTVSLQGTLSKYYDLNINSSRTIDDPRGPGTQINRSIGLNINVPIFSGGAVVAQTRQAVDNYRNTQQQLEQTVRQTMNTTRQSYLSIISGISQVTADKQAIKSNISSLEGMEASYRVGTTTLVDVLNQQQKLFQAQTQYATDRYAYVANWLALKQAAGTLSFEDIKILNKWLVDVPPPKANRKLIKQIVFGGTGLNDDGNHPKHKVKKTKKPITTVDATDVMAKKGIKALFGTN